MPELPGSTYSTGQLREQRICFCFSFAETVPGCRHWWIPIIYLMGTASGGARAWRKILVWHRRDSRQWLYRGRCACAFNSSQALPSCTSFMVRDGRAVCDIAKGIEVVTGLIWVLLSAWRYWLAIVRLSVILCWIGKAILAAGQIEWPFCRMCFLFGSLQTPPRLVSGPIMGLDCCLWPARVASLSHLLVMHDGRRCDR